MININIIWRRMYLRGILHKHAEKEL